MAEYQRPHDPFTPPGSQVGTEGPPYRRGWSAGGQWIDASFRQFRAAPGAWIGITVVYIIIQLVLASLPVLGSLLNTLLNPVLLAGLVLGCATQARTGQMSFAAMFSGFNHPLVGRLIALGAVSIAAYLAAFLVLFVLGASLFGAAMLTADGGAADAIANGDPEAVGALVRALASSWFSLFTLIAVGVTIFFLVGAAFWLAPARIVLAGASITDALADSLSACLRSWRALTLFGLGMFGLAILACVPLMLGFLVFIPMVFASQYVVHEGTFGRPAIGAHDGVPPPPPPPPSWGR